MSFGKVLRKIREREELTIKAMAERLGIPMASYNNVERGASSAQSPTARRIMTSSCLEVEDRERLKMFLKIKPKKRVINVTQADRLAYQRRKNEKYKKDLKEMQR